MKNVILMSKYCQDKYDNNEDTIHSQVICYNTRFSPDVAIIESHIKNILQTYSLECLNNALINLKIKRRSKVNKAA